MVTTPLKLYTERTIAPVKLNRPYFLYVYSQQVGTYIPGDKIQHLQFAQGQLHLDCVPILQPRFAPNSVSWRQKTAKHFTTGNISFSKNGVTGYGTISHGACPKTATLYSVLATAIPPNVYTTQITKKRYPAGTDPNTLSAGAWQPGLELQLGYRYDLTSGIPKPVVLLNKVDMAGEFALLNTSEHHLKITLNLDTDADALNAQNSNLYVAGQLILSPFGDTFTGTISQTCHDRATDPNVYLWKGTAPCQQGGFRAAAPVQLSTADLVQDDDLNINVLVTLLPDENVSQMSYSMMVENMKWTMGQRPEETQWLNDFFNQNPPVLDTDRTTLINQNLSWYQDKFAVSYLAKGMSEAPDPNTPPPIQLSDDQKAKLDYYLKTGLSQSKEYNIQSTGIYTQAYVQGQTELPAYINDGGEKWAAQVFDYLTKPDQFQQAMLRLQTEFDMTLTNNSTTLLSVLEPAGTYAQKYQEMLLGRLTLQTGLLGTTIQDEDVTLNWLPQALEYLLSTGGSSPSTSLGSLGDTPDDFQQAVANIKDAFTYFGDAAATAKAIYDTLALYKGYSLIKQLSQAEAAFTAKYPTLAGLGKLFTFLAWAGGVFNTAIAFMNWDPQGDTKKASVINKCVDLVLTLASEGIDLLNPFVAGSIAALENAMSESGRLTTVVEDIVKTCVSGEVETGEAVWRLEAVLSGLKLADQEAKTFETPALWEKIFSKASTVVKVFAVAVTATTLVLNVIDFARDIINGSPLQQTIIDGITMGLTLGTLVIQIIELAVESVVCTVLSAAFALLGLVMTIIELFLPKPKEPTPAETFQQNYANPFIDTLPAPPATTTLSRLATGLPAVQLIYNPA